MEVTSVFRVNVWIFALLVCLGPRVGGAQIVNGLDDVDSTKEGFSAAIEFPVEWRTGNTNLLRGGGRASASYRSGDHLMFFQLSADYGGKRSSAGDPYDPYSSNTFEHLRYRYHLRGPWSVEALVQHAANEIKRLRLRALAGAGLRFQTSEAKWGFVAIGSTYLRSYEQILLNCDDLYGDYSMAVQLCNINESTETAWEHRWSNYLQLAFKLGEKVSLVQTTFFQPDLQDFGDVRVLTEGSLVIGAGRLYVKTSLVVSYDSHPPLSIYPLDTIVKNALGFVF